MLSQSRRRGEVVQVLRRVGYPDVAEAVMRSLPDPVELDEVVRFLSGYGITYSMLTDRMGGST